MSDELPPEVAAVLANAGNDFIGQLKEAAARSSSDNRPTG